jgi:hypothetical protein
MIDEFLKSGNLGGLRLGLSRAQVRELLGAEKDYSQRSRKNEIWRYDSLQVSFIEDSLCLIGLYFEQGDRVLRLPRTLVPAGKIVCEVSSIPEVEQHVLALGLHFAVVEDLTFDDQRVIHIEESGVGIIFFQGELNKILRSQE